MTVGSIPVATCICTVVVVVVYVYTNVMQHSLTVGDDESKRTLVMK